MYYTISELARKVSNHHLEILLLLDKDFELMTTEGASYRCWMVFEEEDIRFTIQNRSANRMHELSLLKSIEEQRNGYFRYSISDKGKLLLEKISVAESTRMKAVEANLHRKGIEGIIYSKI